MPTLSDAISIYSGVNPRVTGTSTWRDALEAITDGTFAEEIAKLRAFTDSTAAKKYKNTLPSVSFCCTFKQKRARTTVKTATGFIIPDLDHVADVESVFSRLTADPYTWFAFRSPSGDGIKCGFRAELIKTDEDIKAFFASVEDYFLKAYGITIDSACKDISRLTFLSHDPEAYVATSPELFPVGCEKTAPEEQGGPARVTLADHGIGKAKYAAKVLESCCRKISQSLPGEQHRVRLDMACLAGGYVHYLDDSTVYAALEAAVGASGAVDMKAAMATIRDGMEYGKARPITIQDREAPKQDQAAGKAEAKRDDEPKPEPSFFASLDLSESLANQFVHHIPPPLDWLFDHSFPTGQIGFVVGPAGAGKSTFLIHTAAAIVTGKAVIGDKLRPYHKGKVFALFCEENRAILWHRLHKVTNELFPPVRDPMGAGNLNFNPSFELQEFGNNVFAIPGAGSDLRFVERTPLGPVPTIAYLDLLAKLESIPDLACVVLDPLSRIYGQDENDNSQATLFCSLLERIATRTGANVIVSHHVGKNAAADQKTGKFILSKALSPDCIRGASALTGAARWQMNLFPLDNSTAKKELDKTGPDGKYLVAAVTKNNNGPKCQFYLERHTNTLAPIDGIDAKAEERLLWYVIADKVVGTVAAAPADKPYTVKALAEAHCVPWKAEHPGCTIPVIKAAIHVAIEEGRLVETEKPNAKNRLTTYLAIPDETPDEAELIPDGIPDDFTPDTPDDTGQNDSSGVNRLDLLDFVTGQKDTGQIETSGV